MKLIFSLLIAVLFSPIGQALEAPTYIWESQSGFQKPTNPSCTLTSFQDTELRLTQKAGALKSKPRSLSKFHKAIIPSASLISLKTDATQDKLFKIKNHYLTTLIAPNSLTPLIPAKSPLAQINQSGYWRSDNTLSLKNQVLLARISTSNQSLPDPRLQTGSLFIAALDSQKNYQALSCCTNSSCKRFNLFNVYEVKDKALSKPYLKVALSEKPLGFFSHLEVLPQHFNSLSSAPNTQETDQKELSEAPDSDAQALAQLPPLPVPVWDQRRMIYKHLDWKCSVEHIQNYKTLRVSFHTFMKASDPYENLRSDRVGKTEVQSILPIYSLVRLKTRYIPSNIRQSIQVVRVSRNKLTLQQPNLAHSGEDSYIHRDSLLSLNKAIFQIPKSKADKIGGEFLTATTNEEGRYKLQICKTPAGNEYFAIFNIYNRNKQKVGEIGANTDHFKLFRGMVGQSIENFDQVLQTPTLRGRQHREQIQQRTKRAQKKTSATATKKKTPPLVKKETPKNVPKKKSLKQNKIICSPSSTQEPPFLISTNHHMGRKIYEHFYSPSNLNTPSRYIPLQSVVTPLQIENQLQTKNNKLRIEVRSLPNSKSEKNLKKARFRLMSRHHRHRENLPMTFYKRKGKRLKLTRVKTSETGFVSLKSLILPSRGASVNKSKLARKIPNKQSYRFIIHKRGGKVIDTQSGKILNGKAFDVVIRRGQYQTNRCCKDKKCETLYLFKEKTYKNKKPITIKVNPKKDRQIISKIFPVKQSHYKAIAESLNSIRRSAYGKKYLWNTKGIEYFEMYPKLNGGMRKMIFHPDTLRGPHNGFHYFNKRPGTDVKGEGAFLRPLAACTFNRVKEAFAKICKGAGCQTQWGDLYHPKEARMHRTHHSGNCIDTRPFRKNSDSDMAFNYNSYVRPKGKKGKDGLKPKASLRYSRLRTTQFMQLVRQAGGTMMFFNDAKLRRIVKGGIRRMGGHSNHMHFCFEPRLSRRKMTKACFQGLDTSKVIQTSSQKKKKRTSRQTKKKKG